MINADKIQILVAFSVTSITAPLAGVAVGGYIADKQVNDKKLKKF